MAAGILTLISFALKGMGMLFRVYLSDRMGSAGLGLYQLVLSVYSMFATFATSGFSVAVSRLAAEKLGDGSNRRGAGRVLLASSVLAVGMGALAGGVLYIGGSYFAASLVGDKDMASSLRVLALSMPFMSLSACLKGYFVAVGQIYKPAVASLFEQTAKIFITVYTFELVCGADTTPHTLCLGVVSGLTAGECLSYVFLFLLYAFFSGNKGVGKAQDSVPKAFKTVASVTLPIAASAYVTNLLHSVESVLIPSRFVLYGGDREKALSDFGVIRGMSIPLLFFPYAFLGALLSIQVPAVSRLNVAEDKVERNRLIERIMDMTIGFSIACGGFFLLFPHQVSMAVYGNAECVQSLRLLASVTPLMYIETMCDGLLKTVGEQKRTLLYSVINSVFRIVSVLVFIPLSGAVGYIWLLIVSNTLSFLLCFVRLKRVTGLKYGGRKLLRAVSDAALCLAVAWLVCAVASPHHPMVFTVLAGGVTAAVYLALQKVGTKKC